MKKIIICIALMTLFLTCKKEHAGKNIYMTKPTLTYRYGDLIVVRDIISGNVTTVFSGYDANPQINPSYPAWSSDGSKICFITSPYPLITNDLYTVNISISPIDGLPVGSNPTKIGDGAAGGGRYGQAKWRPGTNQIAYVWKRTGETDKIHLLPSAGGPATVIYSTANTDWVIERNLSFNDIAFKSDGSRLVFCERQTSTGSLFLKVLDLTNNSVIKSINLSQYKSIHSLDWAKKAGSNIVAIETVPFCDGTVSGNSDIRQIYTVDVGSATPIMSWIKNDAGDINWSSDDTQFAMTAWIARISAVGSSCALSVYQDIKIFTIATPLIDYLGSTSSYQGFYLDWRR